MKGKWRIVAMPDYTPDHPDMIEPTCIFFDGNGGGEFAFGCLTGTVHNAKKSAAFAFTWDGNEEMDRACGDGWAELQTDGSLKGQICFNGGDEANFIARPWDTCSTALLGWVGGGKKLVTVRLWPQ